MKGQHSPKLTQGEGAARVFTSPDKCFCISTHLQSSWWQDQRPTQPAGSRCPPCNWRLNAPSSGVDPGLHPPFPGLQTSLGRRMPSSACLPSVHSRQWLEDALRENEPGSCFVFLVGTKKDLLVSTPELEA